MNRINPIRIFSIDPALANVGWVVLDFDPNDPPADNIPSWIKDKDTTGQHTYSCFKRVDGGTFSTNNEMTVNERLVHQLDEIHLLCAIHKPEMIAFESQLEVGVSRCTWGVAIQFGILFPYFRANHRQVRLSRCPGNQWEEQNCGNSVFNHVDHIPNYGVSIKPPQLQSITHHEKSTKPSIVKQRYREVSGDNRKRVTDHEADAFFMGVYAGRFWATCLEMCWSVDFLTQKEQNVFLNPDKGMMGRKFESWWINF